MFLPGPEHKNEVNRLGSRLWHYPSTNNIRCGHVNFPWQFSGARQINELQQRLRRRLWVQLRQLQFASLPSPLSQFSQLTWPVSPVCLSFSLGPFVNGFGGSFGARRTCAHIFRYYNVVHTLLAVPLTDIFRLLLPATAPAAAPASGRARSWRANFQLFASISFRGLWNGTNLLKRQLQRLGTDRNWPKTVFCQLHSSWECAVINTLTIIPCSYWKRWKLFIVH